MIEAADEWANDQIQKMDKEMPRKGESKSAQNLINE